MRPEDYENLYRNEETLWWFVGMRRIHECFIRPQSGRALKILDAGCGTGADIGHLASLGHTVVGIDYSADALPWLRRRGLDQVAQASVTDLPFPDGVFDLVGSFDVVCQVPAPADRRSIAEMARVLKPGGHLLIRVPAFRWLWSSNDDDLRTAQRYNLAEVIAMLEDHGFEIRAASYANALLFPLAVLRRALKRVGIAPGSNVRPMPAGLQWLNPLFARILASEGPRLARGWRFPAGLSVIAWARKPI